MKRDTAIILSVAVAMAVSSFLLIPADGSDAAGSAYVDVHDETELRSELSNRTPLIRLASSMTIASDLYIPKDVTLLLPYGPEDTTGYTNAVNVDGSRASSAPDNDTYCKCRLTLGGTTTVDGSVIIGSYVGADKTFWYQGHTSYHHATITNNGQIVLRTGSSLTCFGYLNGTGTVTALQGSTVMEPLVITDFSGGDHMLNLYKQSEPMFDRYSIHNISCTMTLEYGSVLRCKLTLYIQGQMNTGEINFLGTGDSLINLREGSSLTMSFDSKRYIESKESYNLHKDVIGCTMDFHGGADISMFDAVVYGQTVTLERFTIPYNMTFLLEDGSYLLDVDLRVLPGGTLTVGKDATLVVKNKLVSYWGLEDKDYRGIRYPSANVLGQFGLESSGHFVTLGRTYFVNGSIFYGIAEVSGTGAQIITGMLTRFYESELSFGSSDSNVRIPMGGCIIDENGNKVLLQADSEYKVKTEKTFLMTEYLQDGTTHPLNNMFQGGLKSSKAAYTEVKGECTGGTVSRDLLLELLDSGGLGGYANFVINLGGNKTIKVESDAIQLLKVDNCIITLTSGNVSLTIPYATLSEMNGEFSAVFDPIPNEKQTSTVGKKQHFGILTSFDGKEFDMFPGSVIIRYVVDRSTIEDVDKMQVWHIASNGTARGYQVAYEDGTILMESSESGLFAVAYEDVPKNVLDTDKMMNILIFLGIGIALSAVLLMALVYILRKRSKASGTN